MIFFLFYFHPLAPTSLRIQSCALAGCNPQSHCSPRSHCHCLKQQHSNFTYRILSTYTPNLFVLASSQTRSMENKIELFLANRDSVIHQTQLAHGDEMAQLFQMGIISSCLKKMYLYRGPQPSFLGTNCDFAEVKEKILTPHECAQQGMPFAQCSGSRSKPSLTKRA